jgi:hypothetical protein
MKRTKKTILLITLGCLTAVGHTAAHTPPSDRQISQTLANPALVRTLVADANAEEAGEVLLRLLQRILAADIAQSQKNFLASYYSARIAFLLGDEASQLAEWIIPRCPTELLPAVWAGLSVGGRGSSATMDTLRELAGENDAWLQAVNAPNIPLSDPVYSQLLISLGASQSLPPVVTDSLPPPIPVGQDEPAPTVPPAQRPRPIIPEPYAGQS